MMRGAASRSRPARRAIFDSVHCSRGYRVSLGGADDYYLKNWSVEGGRRDGETLDIPAGAAAGALPAIPCAGHSPISGTVYRDGLRSQARWFGPTPATAAIESNSDGNEFYGLPAGEYELFAVEDGTR